MFSNKKLHKKPKAKVKYHIKASIVDVHNKSIMKYKQVLVVREIPHNAEASIKQVSEH
mgnify:CR=1 FL=1|jgi:hypothetical protein